MPLNYRRSGVTYQINLYDSETPGWDDSLKIRSSGATKYAEISTNLSHPSASHMRVRKDGTTHAVLSEKSGSGLWAWGDGTYGKLGDGETSDKSSPVQIDSRMNWAAIDADSSHTIAIKTDGTLWSWGYNGSGQLGQGDVVSRSSPEQVGALTTWDRVVVGQWSSSFAVKEDGTLWAWGDNNNGVLGLETPTSQNESTPQQVGALTNWNPPALYNWTAYVVKTDGTLWSWGAGGVGALGNGLPSGDISSPTQVGSGTYWSTVAGGHYFGIAVRSNGTLWSWGQAANGVLGRTDLVDRSSPTQIGGLTTWSKVACFESGAVAIKTDGTLWAWGGGGSGQLAQGADLASKSSPVQVGGLTNWQEISCFRYGSVALKTDGTLWSWGYNNKGQLGVGDTVTRSSPEQIGSLTTWTSIMTSGNYHALAVKTN